MGIVYTFIIIFIFICYLLGLYKTTKTLYNLKIRSHADNNANYKLMAKTKTLPLLHIYNHCLDLYTKIKSRYIIKMQNLCPGVPSSIIIMYLF